MPFQRRERRRDTVVLISFMMWAVEKIYVEFAKNRKVFCDLRRHLPRIVQMRQRIRHRILIILHERFYQCRIGIGKILSARLEHIHKRALHFRGVKNPSDAAFSRRGARPGLRVGAHVDPPTAQRVVHDGKRHFHKFHVLVGIQPMRL
jgi:hypothetical protein